MMEIKTYNSLHELSRDSWNLCFANEVETYDYLLAIEESGIKGFTWRYITAWQNGKLIAAIPAFVSDYNLDTTLQGIGKKITSAIRLAMPKLLSLKLASLGSPCTENAIIGFHPDINANQKPQLTQEILRGFENYAASQNCKLLGIKDIPESDSAIWQEALTACKFTALPSLPAACLDIKFASIDEYIAGLSYKTRKNMRQKLKSLNAVRVEKTNNVTAALPQIMALYNDTRGRSEWQFEELTENYFKNVLAYMPENAFCTLYYAGNELLAINLLLHNRDMLVDKFFCMNSETGRQYNLYFLSWFNNIEYCIENGIKHYQSGQTYYENKVRLGSRLTRNTMYFKHRNILAQGILKLVAPLLAVDEPLGEAA